VTKINKILIANRGEIACRVMKTCRKMDIKSVAVYSDADRKALHVRMADEAVHIGASPATESYLVIDKIIAACKSSGADAVHPGYGFLSENAEFARRLKKAGITFIGPSPESMEAMGLKDAAKKLMEKAGVPVTPGYHGKDQDAKLLKAKAGMIGYPVLIKATAGGGGKGMRIAHNDAALKNALGVAMKEAEAAFGDGSIYLEKFVEGGRHIEVQIMGDNNGKIATLGERECSIQRRHQKLIEETPAFIMKDSLRRAIIKAGHRAAKAVNYTNAGTVEFLLARDDSFYFLELNARIQVEHAVTEEVTRKDLVAEQIRIACGEPLGYTSLRPRGHAIEARIYAEDPENNFAPNPGLIKRCHIPGGPGIRVDTHIFAGYMVPRYYDSLLAKVIAWGEDRNQATERLAGALDEFRIQGIKTTAALCATIVRSGRFRRGDISMDMLQHFLPKQAH